MDYLGAAALQSRSQQSAELIIDIRRQPSENLQNFQPIHDRSCDTFRLASAFSQTAILGETKERQPGYGEFENFTILSYTDLDGWDQAAEFRISKDGKHAYISNYQGFSIVDVSDPARPKVVSRVKNDPSVQSQYIDVLGDLLIVNQEGVRDEKIKSWESGILHHARGIFRLDKARLSARNQTSLMFTVCERSFFVLFSPRLWLTVKQVEARRLLSRRM